VCQLVPQGVAALGIPGTRPQRSRQADEVLAGVRVTHAAREPAIELDAETGADGLHGALYAIRRAGVSFGLVQRGQEFRAALCEGQQCVVAPGTTSRVVVLGLRDTFDGGHAASQWPGTSQTHRAGLSPSG